MREPTPPKTLLAMQTWFASFLTRPLHTMSGPLLLPVYERSSIQDIEQHIAPGLILRPEEQIGYYNQQYWWRLFGLLHKHYPALVCLFGHADFNAFIAEPYFLRYPPTSWFLPDLGRLLPAWIEESYHEEDREIVLNVAQVDQAHEQLLHENEGAQIQLTLDGDFLALRKALLEHPVEHWQTADFPELKWFPTPRELVLYRTFDGVYTA